MAASFIHWLFGARIKTGIALTLFVVSLFGIGVTAFFSVEVDRFVFDQTTSMFVSHAQTEAEKEIIPQDRILHWREAGSIDVFQRYAAMLSSMGKPVVRFNLYSPDALVVWSSSAADIGKTEEPENVAQTRGGTVFIEHAEATNETVMQTGITHLIEVYIPLKKTDGMIVGVAELYIDVTREASLIWTIQLAVGLSVFFGIALTFLLFYRTFVRENKEMERLILERTASLQELQSQYRNVVEGSLIGIYVVQDGVFQFVNGPFAKIFGYTKPSELIGKPYHIVATKIGLAEAKQNGLEQRLRGKGVPARYVFHGRRKDGKTIFIEVLSNPGRANGKPAVIGSLQDVTDRIRAENELRNARDTAQQYLDIADVLLIAVDTKLKIRMINRRGAQILGVSADAAIGEDFITTYFAKRDHEAIFAHYRALLQGKHEEEKEHEFPILRTNGERSYLTWRHVVMRDEAGNVTGILSSGEDVTEKRKAMADERIQLRITALFSKEKGNRELMKEMQEVICEELDWLYAENWVLDTKQGMVSRYSTYISSRLHETVILSKGGSRAKFPFLENPENSYFNLDHPLWIEDLQYDGIFARKEDARHDGFVSALLFPYVIDDESRKALAVFYFVYPRKPDEDVEAVLRSVRDQYLAYLTRVRSIARVKELNDLRNTFIQIVSHQLRTPLNAMRWNLEALLAGELGALKREQKEFVRITHLADLELIDRLHDLLTAMDIEEGRVTVIKAQGSIESLWNSVLTDWKRACSAKELRCSYVAPKEALPAVEFDQEKLREVFEKISSNAVDYTAAGGRVTAKMMRTASGIRFEVSDTGIGIPEAEQARIFTRFFRASNASIMKPDASGLGLSIAKYYVEQHGGTMGFTSVENEGSTFWFEIPLPASKL